MFRAIDREAKIRFINFVFEEICGEGPKSPISSMLDNEVTFRRCDEGLLEGLEGSSDRNVFRRRAVIWMLMRMSRKRGEGGCWEQFPLENVQLRRRIDHLQNKLEQSAHQHKEQALRHEHDQHEALESTSRVVGRLKKRLGDVEEMLLEEQTQRKALEKKAAELSAANEQHLSAMRKAQSSLTASKAELADERKKANRQRIEILNLEQQIRTLRAAPPLWQIVQKHQHNK
eukprot:g586.t1